MEYEINLIKYSKTDFQILVTHKNSNIQHIPCVINFLSFFLNICRQNNTAKTKLMLIKRNDIVAHSGLSPNAS